MDGARTARTIFFRKIPQCVNFSGAFFESLGRAWVVRTRRMDDASVFLVLRYSPEACEICRDFLSVVQPPSYRGHAKAGLGP